MRRPNLLPLLSVGVVALLLVVISLYGINRAEARDFYGTPLNEPVTVAATELTAADGARVTLPDTWRGKVVLLYFGFTTCPDVCPLTLGRLAKIYEDLGEPEGVQVVMVSVDPERDTPERTQAYAQAFAPSFVGLSGSAADIARAAKNVYVGFGGVGGKNFTHTDAVIVLDREGRMRLVYGQDKVLYLADDLPKMLAARDW